MFRLPSLDVRFAAVADTEEQAADFRIRPKKRMNALRKADGRRGGKSSLTLQSNGAVSNTLPTDTTRPIRAVAQAFDVLSGAGLEYVRFHNWLPARATYFSIEAESQRTTRQGPVSEDLFSAAR